MTDIGDVAKKLCLSCLRAQPLDAFPPLPGSPGGRRSMCLTCLGPIRERVSGNGGNSKAASQQALPRPSRQVVAVAQRRRGIGHVSEEWRAWAAGLLAKPAGWVILDTETTGFGAADIIEIAAISLDGTVLCDTLIRPQLPIPAKVSALTGITEQDVLLAPPFAMVYETRLAQMLASAKLLIYCERYSNIGSWPNAVPVRRSRRAPVGAESRSWHVQTFGA